VLGGDYPVSTKEQGMLYALDELDALGLTQQVRPQDRVRQRAGAVRQAAFGTLSVP